MRRRRLIIAFLLLVAAPVGAFVGLRLYLASEWGRQQVEAELAAAIGARVELGAVDAGLWSTSLHDLRVYLPGDGDTPTAAIDGLRVALPLWRLLDPDAIVQHLTLTGAAVTLRFDAAGRILIEPPQGQGKGPQKLLARLVDARVTLKQEGKPDFQVQGIRAVAGGTGEQLTLKGTAHDPHWGDWTVLARVDSASGAAKLQLKTDRVQVTQARLRGLPFVDADVWETFTAEGVTPVELTVWFDGQAHYRVALEPKDTSIHVTAIDLSAQGASGKVLIEDGRVLLEGVQGQVAGGSLALDGDLDFRTKPERLRFDLKGAGLDLRRLPKSWDLPEFLEGRLNGQAKLGVTLLPGGVRTAGSGRGQIVDARIGGAATAEPVEVQLLSLGKGFRFQTGPQHGLSFRFANDLANVVADALRHTARPLADAGRSLTDWRLPARRDTASAYLRFHVDLKEVDLGRFLAGIGIPLAIPVEGTAAINVHVDLPVDTLAEPRCYRMAGTVRLPLLKAADLEFHDVAARLDYRDGVLRVTDVTGRTGVNGLPVGGFRGTASLGLVPAGALEANLRLDGVPLPKSLSEGRGLAGWLSGNLQVRAPLERFGDANAWEATLQLDDSRLLLAGRTLALTAEQVQLRQGVLSSSALVGTIDGVEIAALGSLELAKPHAFVVDLTLEHAEVDQLRKLLEVPPLPLEGALTATTRVEGTLEPLRFQAGGHITAAQLLVNRLPFTCIELDWKTDGQTVRVEALEARYGFGQVEGTAVVPLHGEESGKAELQFREIDLAPLARQLLDLEGVEGRGFGTIRAQLVPLAGDGRRELTCQLDYHLPRVQFKGLAGERLRGTAYHDGREWSYRCDGELLGGRLHAEGSMAERSPVLKLTLEGARIERLRREMLRDADALPLFGRIDLELTQRREAGDPGSQARGRLWVQQLSWDTSELADRLQADVQMRGSELILENASGSFCRGLLRGRAVLNTLHFERSYIDLTLDRGEAQDLLVPWPELAKQISGTVEARLQTTMGQPWRTSGMIALTRGRLFGIEVAEWRLPVDLAYSSSAGTGQLEIRDSHAQIARGRAVAQASYSWGHGNRLEGKVRFIDVNLAELVPASSDFNRLDGGTVTGRLDFAGSNFTSLNDVTASLEANMKQTRVFEFPVFQQLAPYVAPRQSRRVPFETGDVKARMAHGVVHVERLRLTGGLLQLLIHGSLSLQGRLDLDVTGYTGLNAIQSNLLRGLGVDLPARGPIPNSALARLTNQLSARLVRLRVTGSVRNPQVQPVPLYQLTEEAVRFFLTGSR